jgi:hypothetical protein
MKREGIEEAKNRPGEHSKGEPSSKTIGRLVQIKYSGHFADRTV